MLKSFEPAIAALDVAPAKHPDHPDGLLHRMRALGQRAMVCAARRVLFNAAVPKLAGFIACERHDMWLAMRSFDNARAARVTAPVTLSERRARAFDDWIGIPASGVRRRSRNGMRLVVVETTRCKIRPM